MKDETINLRPSYQRGVVWSKSQKQLLIDTILRDLDVPKIYLREVDSPPYEEEAVDGQQRLTSIYEFFCDKFELDKYSEDVKGIETKGRKFSQLDEKIKDIFESYELTVVTLRNASEEEVEEMFLRLQNGTTLNAAEKRNAMNGNMKSFVRDLAYHPFFENCGFKNQRFAFDLVASQMVRVFLAGKPCAVKNSDLVKLYEQNEDFEINGKQARQIRQILDLMANVFPEKTPELTKLTSLSLFSVFAYLKENFVIADRFLELHDWFINFEQARKNKDDQPLDELDSELSAYQLHLSRTTDGQDSVEGRHQYLLGRLMQDIPNLTPLDQKRTFTPEQRLAIYRRDKHLCQVRLACQGEECIWEHWHADHRIAWSKGGTTTVENGQVSCMACNLAKSNT